MTYCHLKSIPALILFGLLSCQFSSTGYAQPSPKDALRLTPMQPDVEFDTPTKEEVGKCTVTSDKEGNETAWVVQGQAGETLRRFVDSNGDNKVDVWRYFRGGIEVYRDIDHDFNGKADQYRWLGTAGTRWGLDPNEDGVIDSWQAISPEEVSQQIVESIKNGDADRFRSVLLNAKELASLGLGKLIRENLAARMEAATRSFDKVVSSQTPITPNTQWVDFGGMRPGTIPAGTDGSSRDITVYENVVAMVETDGKPAQVPIGTLVHVGSGWRVVGLPLANGDAAAPQFVFFEATNQPQNFGVSEKTEKLILMLEQIDKQLASARTPREITKLNRRRADTLEALALEAKSAKDQDMWWTQFTDAVGTAAQSGTFPDGTKRLAKLLTRLERSSGNRSLMAHVKFTHMSADYAAQLQAEDADYAKIQEQWLGQLESFITEFPTSDNAPEAMLQLALAKEFAGEEKEANQWYTKIVSDFRGSPLAAKAAGAKRRLECIGKTMRLEGRTVQGKAFDISRLRGKTVVLHYWATWCGPCKQDMEIMKDLQKEFQGQDLEIVGVNLDSQPEEVARFFRAEPPTWTHLYDKGGLDSRLAAEMGVFTLPVTLLIDERGRVVNRQLHGGQLRAELEKLLR